MLSTLFKNTDATPAPQIIVINYPAPDTPLVGSLQARFPATSVKIQSILHNNIKWLHPYSHPDEGITSILAPNHHVIQDFISAVHYKVASTTYLCESNETDHPITELDLHKNMVVLGMNAFIFDITSRKCSVKPFSSKLGVAENVPIFYGEIAYHCQ